jgi:hypothetical protein
MCAPLAGTLSGAHSIIPPPPAAPVPVLTVKKIQVPSVATWAMRPLVRAGDRTARPHVLGVVSFTART